MTHLAMPPTEGQAGRHELLPLGGDGLEELVEGAGGRDRIARKLLADPCHLVRRACQIADYEIGAAEREPDAAAGR